ncbi:hypothetical protein JUJ52_07425 [Virgibacillus sp. AGTR]|uniref:hypothetical protein n=1 Tax=Virgibacillus sp. AGTR TaxID=2812055 RepID=UPI001965FA16|nr:hypothetical protein [Virgibacillus sp. AGTR]MCC2249798.1 hypothetical protein [Virgibacillus sp. AGTR]QRZ19185.1 hypothetical protein JUJ52_05630 [Virgibacillus sp. AGTR]
MLKKILALIIFPVMIILASQTFPSESIAAETTGNESPKNEINAVKYFGPFPFTTRDGKWDGQFSVPSLGDVTIRLSGEDLYWESGRVRICNRDSGRCTLWGPLSVGTQPSRTITDVLPGVYYVDVDYAMNVFSGTSTIEVRY